MKFRHLLLLPAVILLTAFAMKPAKPAYQVFDLRSKVSSYDKLLKEALTADVVLFGEMHNNPICHWLELELTKDIYARKKQDLVLGAEMFEQDNQSVLDSFLKQQIDEKRFKVACRLWPNYATDYSPLVEFAQTNKLAFSATNIPRRYAKLVNKGGFTSLDTLPDWQKAWIAPLPITYDSNLRGYKEDFMKAVGGHGTPNMAKSQASKDATMAYFILKNYSKGKLFLHYNGTFHSNNYQGIYWYLKKANPALKIVTIASVEQDSIDKLETDNQHLADFILCIPGSMTKTY